MGSLGGIFHLFGISGSALTAERARLDDIAANIANKDTPDYKARHAVFEQIVGADGRSGGVRVAAEVEDSSTMRVSDPTNPAADADGFVNRPNVDPIAEFADMVSTQRAFQLNAEVIQTAKGMYRNAIDLLTR